MASSSSVILSLNSMGEEASLPANPLVKELQTYGEVMESKAEQGAILKNILTKYCEALTIMVDGEIQEMPTKELSGKARIQYIFHSIFAKSLEDIEDPSDEDIQMAIKKFTGPTPLFVSEVPFEVLVRRQIARLLDPSLQCLQLVYDEVVKMSRACEVTELQRFPVLRKRLDEVAGEFFCDCVKAAERMIRNLIEMELGYIYSLNPKFIGRSKVIELAMLQIRSPQGSPTQSNNERPFSFGISSILGSRASSGEGPSRSPAQTVDDVEQLPSTIQSREPPAILRPLEMTEHEAWGIFVTKSLFRSYYDIVRMNTQDSVIKYIMHFLVNHTKRELHNHFIQTLYSVNLFEELLQEQDEVIVKRKRTREILHDLAQAIQFAEAAQVAKDKSRPGVLSLVNNQLARHSEAFNGGSARKQQNKGSVEGKKVGRRALVANDDEVNELRLQVEKLEEMASRNKKQKLSRKKKEVVYVVRHLTRTRKALAEAEATHASASNAVVSRE